MDVFEASYEDELISSPEFVIQSVVSSHTK